MKYATIDLPKKTKGSEIIDALSKSFTKMKWYSTVKSHDKLYEPDPNMGQGDYLVIACTNKMGALGRWAEAVINDQKEYDKISFASGKSGLNRELPFLKDDHLEKLKTSLYENLVY